MNACVCMREVQEVIDYKYINFCVNLKLIIFSCLYQHSFQFLSSFRFSFLFFFYYKSVHTNPYSAHEGISFMFSSSSLMILKLMLMMMMMMLMVHTLFYAIINPCVCLHREREFIEEYILCV